MQIRKDEEGGDLDAVRGLVPSIVVGSAVWAIVVAIAVMLWG